MSKAKRKTNAIALDSQQTDLIGRSFLEAQIIRAGFEVAYPARDKGIDLIAYSDVEEAPFHAVPIQVKASSTKIFCVYRKYLRRNIVMAYVWNIHGEQRLFLIPHDKAVTFLPKKTRSTASWRGVKAKGQKTRKGGWSTRKPSKTLEARMALYEGSFFALERLRRR